MADDRRQYLVPFAELVDRLSVAQIKLVLLKEGQSSFLDEIRRLCHDIDLIVAEKQLPLSARLLRIVIVLAQMNVHIWYLKDRMQQDDDRYAELLKLAHQLNGIRNQMKNLLLEEAGERDQSAERSNVGTDGLAGWDVGIT